MTEKELKEQIKEIRGRTFPMGVTLLLAVGSGVGLCLIALSFLQQGFPVYSGRDFKVHFDEQWKAKTSEDWIDIYFKEQFQECGDNCWAGYPNIGGYCMLVCERIDDELELDYEFGEEDRTGCRVSCNRAYNDFIREQKLDEMLYGLEDYQEVCECVEEEVVEHVMLAREWCYEHNKRITNTCFEKCCMGIEYVHTGCSIEWCINPCEEDMGGLTNCGAFNKTEVRVWNETPCKPNKTRCNYVKWK